MDPAILKVPDARLRATAQHGERHATTLADERDPVRLARDVRVRCGELGDFARRNATSAPDGTFVLAAVARGTDDGVRRGAGAESFSVGSSDGDAVRVTLRGTGEQR